MEDHACLKSVTHPLMIITAYGTNQQPSDSGHTLLLTLPPPSSNYNDFWQSMACGKSPGLVAICQILAMAPPPPPHPCSGAKNEQIVPKHRGDLGRPHAVRERQ